MANINIALPSPLNTWVSARISGPAANSVILDTGPLAAGYYDFFFNMVISDTVVTGKGMVIEHRNATNLTTLKNLGGCPSSGHPEFNLYKFAISANERIRIITGPNSGGSGTFYVALIGFHLL